MAIVLFILKIIGITLLVLLLVIILVLLALLFVPLRYRIRLSIDGEGQNRSLSFRARAYWLLHLVAAEAKYEDGQADAFLRILFWRKKLLNNEEAEEEEETVKEDAEEKTDNTAEEAVKPPKQPMSSEQKKESDGQDSSVENSSEVASSQNVGEPRETKDLKSGRDDVAEYSSGQSKSSESGKSSGQPKKETESTKKVKAGSSKQADSSYGKPGILARIKKIFNDISTLRKKITYVLEDERNKKAFSHLKINLIKILKAIMPRKLSLDLQFSMGAPDITGEVLGVCAMFPVLYQPGNHLSPDFESDEAYAEGTVNARGRIYLYQILFPVLRVVFDKNCKRLYRMLKKYFR